MNNITEQLAGIFALVSGVAILSVIVSTKSNTTGVVQSLFSGFGNILSVATSPVTGQSNTSNLSYPTSSGIGLNSLDNFNVNGLQG